MIEPSIIASTVFNGFLIGLVAWLLNDKLKNVDFRLSRIEGTFFKNGSSNGRHDCTHDDE